MTVSTTDLLDLLTKAGELDFSVFVKKDDEGDYVVKFYELYSNEFDEKVVITKECESDWNKGTSSFDYMMDTFVNMLKQKEEVELKEQKRQEVLAKLTQEEKELMGVG